MCRIAGIIGKNSASLQRNIVAMRDAMQHGGPDSAGIYMDEANHLALGHRRLSIIDLSDAGIQPMIDDELIIVFNGEIYNYQELRAELKSAGYNFKTETDTEVIIKAYRQWGVESFTKLKGMFALAIYDKRKGEIVLARDHAGIKPLYYCTDGSKLYFASEVRAFLSLNPNWEENENWKVYFLTYGYLPKHITTLKGVKPLPKSSYATINVHTLQMKVALYEEELYTEEIRNEGQAKEYVRATLTKAVERHLISDAPIGLFLSGGIDSSILTLLAKPYKENDLHTLSIDFDDPNFSEGQYQNIIVEKCKPHHQSFLLTEKVFIDHFTDIMKAMDQPSADGINSYFICKYAKESGLKAVLSGLGSDEIFGGYPSFRMSKYVRNTSAVPGFMFSMAGISPKDKYKKIAFLKRKDPIGEYLFYRGYFIPTETAELLGMNVTEVNRLLEEITVPDYVSKLREGNRVSYLESNLYMKDQLLKDVDAMSMWHSIEVRVPFLDKDLLQLVRSISCDVKFGSRPGKHLLIDSFKDILPREIWDRKKQGFVFPFRRWMKENNFMLLGGTSDNRMNNKFMTGNLEWSRYWTYCITENMAATV
jgi:asparagine synthase (glutamine-hydrolysing)